MKTAGSTYQRLRYLFKHYISYNRDIALIFEEFVDIEMNKYYPGNDIVSSHR